MVMDTFALLPILVCEPSRASLLRAAASAWRRIVIDGLACEVAAFDQPQAKRAITAFFRFGRAWAIARN
jgi:uncharacterized protein with PIN domain